MSVQELNWTNLVAPESWSRGEAESKAIMPRDSALLMMKSSCRRRLRELLLGQTEMVAQLLYKSGVIHAPLYLTADLFVFNSL